MISNLGRAARATSTSRPLDAHAHRAGLAASRIASFCLTFDEPLDWEVFTLWFTMLLNRHGDRILRVKGLLWLTGAERPAVLHAIRHLVHPVQHPDLDSTPQDEPRLSRLVFIAEDLAPDALHASYRRFKHHLEETRR
jgi:G3E family GTPase